MGHVRLGGSLPRTRRWQEVIDLIGNQARPENVASATIDAIDEEFSSAGNDPALIRAVWLLTQLPDAARSPRFVEALQELDVPVAQEPTTIELATALSTAISRYVSKTKRRSDIGEMAQHAAVEALSSVLRQRTDTLFAPTPEQVKHQLGQLATRRQFGALARDFFARFTRRCLDYFVGRELPKHVGPDRSFRTLTDQLDFSKALDLHCKQASRIVEDFGGGWYDKARYEQDLTERRTARFVSYALKKIKTELRMGAVA